MLGLVAARARQLLALVQIGARAHGLYGQPLGVHSLEEDLAVGGDDETALPSASTGTVPNT